MKQQRETLQQGNRGCGDVGDVECGTDRVWSVQCEVLTYSGPTVHCELLTEIGQCTV